MVFYNIKYVCAGKFILENGKTWHNLNILKAGNDWMTIWLMVAYKGYNQIRVVICQTTFVQFIIIVYKIYIVYS